MRSVLPPNFLGKTGGQWRKVKLLDLTVLLYHATRGATDDNIGFEDAQQPLGSLLLKLNKHIFIDPNELESALWSANLMDEQGKWWHPKGLSFEEWVKGLLGRDSYNRHRCLIEKKK